ncbi:capsid protein, partial [Circovirus pichong]
VAKRRRYAAPNRRRWRRRHWRRRRYSNRRGHRTNRVYRMRFVRMYRQECAGSGDVNLKFGSDGVNIMLDDFLDWGSINWRLPFEDYRIRLAKFEMRPLNENWGSWHGIGTNVPIQDNHLEDFFKKTGMTADPLANWDGARQWDLRKGFKRLFRPRPQLSITDTDAGNVTAALWLNNPRSAWIPLMKKNDQNLPSPGTRVKHYGLGISWPQPHDAILYHAKVTIYVEFRQMNLTHLSSPK